MHWLNGLKLRKDGIERWMTKVVERYIYESIRKGSEFEVFCIIH